ncbi:hypothetical protein A2U01_0069967 [Trifolium medium]|uniref:Uncharacterized protein n=1 Tax=Trifolium medium TaxID=97028 RepID=A0A392SKJ0_9FABA|nr:hypothetical protein [Trifolium medium]
MQEIMKRAECYIRGEESNAEKRSRDVKERSLDLVDEVREAAHLREFTVKRRAARKYDSKVIPREFKEAIWY